MTHQYGPSRASILPLNDGCYALGAAANCPHNGAMTPSNSASRSVDGFLTDLASREPTPGGGSASALVGAIAAALAAMVGRLNDKKDGTPGPLHSTVATADELRHRLAGLIDRDIDAFNALASSWKLPDDAEHAAEEQTAVARATESPLDIMQQSLEVMRLAVQGLGKSKRNCLSDAGVAGICAYAALESARLNVLINLPGLTDEAQRQGYRARCDALQSEAAGLKSRIDALLAENYA